ncbi:hypothetical protein MY11210_005148 [Beauveria gryllotalpidicola]
MPSDQFLFSAAALGSTAQAQLFTINCSPLTIQRGDPIVWPGRVSPHVHVVTGGTAFQQTQSNEQARDDLRQAPRQEQLLAAAARLDNAISTCTGPRGVDDGGCSLNVGPDGSPGHSSVQQVQVPEPAEPVGKQGPLDKLPGNNPVTGDPV